MCLMIVNSCWSLLWWTATVKSWPSRGNICTENKKEINPDVSRIIFNLPALLLALTRKSPLMTSKNKFYFTGEFDQPVITTENYELQVPHFLSPPIRKKVVGTSCSTVEIEIEFLCCSDFQWCHVKVSWKRQPKHFFFVKYCLYLLVIKTSKSCWLCLFTMQSALPSQ